MKTLLFLLLLFVASFAFSQDKHSTDPYYDYFPENTIVLHYCDSCPNNEGYSFPVNMPDSLLPDVFGTPDKIAHFRPGAAYFYTYGNENTDTVAFYAYDLLKDTAFYKAGFIFVKYPGHMKLERIISCRRAHSTLVVML